MGILSNLTEVALGVDKLIVDPQVIKSFREQSQRYYKALKQSPADASYALTLPCRRAFKQITEHTVHDEVTECLQLETARMTDYVLLTIIYDKILEGLRKPISEGIWAENEPWVVCTWDEINQSQFYSEMMTRIDCALEWIQASILAGNPEETRPTELLRALAYQATTMKASALTKILVDNLSEGEKKRSIKYKEFIGFASRELEKINFTFQDTTQMDDIVNIRLGGEIFQITYDTLLSLWMHTEAGNLERILKTKGMNVEIYKPDTRWPFLMKREEIRTGTPRVHEIRETRAQIPDKLKELGEIAFKTNFEKQTPAINETALECFGYDIHRKERHWHISREIERDPEERPPYWYLNMDEQSRYDPPTGGNQRINLIPFSKEFVWSMQMDASFYGMTSSIKDAKVLTCNREFRKKMKECGHEKVLDAIVTIIRQLILRTFLGT